MISPLYRPNLKKFGSSSNRISEDLGSSEEYPWVGEVFAVLVGVRDTDCTGAGHEELSGGHPRIVNEGAVHFTTGLLEV